jgi:Asp-tRNA(Asn)/Glu-tRNA(Gln) amidotransferase C subunit
MEMTAEFLNVANMILSGIFYDQVKIATVSSYELAKLSLSKKLPLKDEELDIIETEIVSMDKELYSSEESLAKLIAQSETIQNILKQLEKREPEKSKEMVNSFKHNKKMKFDLDLSSVDTVKSSFNNNEDCEIKIKW